MMNDDQKRQMLFDQHDKTIWQLKKAIRECQEAIRESRNIQNKQQQQIQKLMRDVETNQNYINIMR